MRLKEKENFLYFINLDYWETCYDFNQRSIFLFIRRVYIVTLQ